MSKPSKKDFADLINNIAGKDIMSEKQLDQIMRSAKKSYDSKGLTGALDYLKDVTQAPVSTDWMAGIVNQLKTTDGLKNVVDKFDLPMELKKGAGNKPMLSMKTGKPLRTKRRKKKR